MKKLEEKIKQFLQDKLLPLLQIDGGSISLVEITKDSVLKLKLEGNCIGCPGAIFTTKLIETIIKENFKEIREVKFVGWSPAKTHKIEL